MATLRESMDAFLEAEGTSPERPATSYLEQHRRHCSYLAQFYGAKRPMHDFAGESGASLIAGYLDQATTGQLAYRTTRVRLNTLRLVIECARHIGKIAEGPSRWPVPPRGSAGHKRAADYVPRSRLPAVRKFAPSTARATGADRIAVPGEVSLGEAFDVLFKTALRRRSVATRVQHDDRRRYLLAFFGAKRPLSDFAGAAGYRLLQEYVAAEGPKDEGGRGLKFMTIRGRLGTLRLALKEAARRGVIESLPPWPEMPSDYAPRERYLTDEEYRRLRAALPPLRRLWVDLGVWTAQHSSDLNSMRWEHVNLPAGTWLRRNTKNDTRKVSAAKAAWVKMPAELLAILREEHRARAPRPVDFIAGHWDKANHGLRMACIRLGIPHVAPIDLRRTCATWWIERGGTPQSLRKYLGHAANSPMVDKVYARCTPDMLDAGVGALDARPTSKSAPEQPATSAPDPLAEALRNLPATDRARIAQALGVEVRP